MNNNFQVQKIDARLQPLIEVAKGASWAYDLAGRIMREQDAKFDVIVDPSQLGADEHGRIAYLSNGRFEFFEPTKVMLQQIATELGIPFRTLEKFREHGDKNLFAQVVTRMFRGYDDEFVKDPSNKKRSPKDFMLRSYRREDGGNVGRALLSNSYAPIDNIDTIESAMTAVADSGMDFVFKKHDFTDQRMYVVLEAPELSASLTDYVRTYNPPGGPRGPKELRMQMVISNSEVGRGSMQVYPRLEELVCWNGMTRRSDGYSRTHRGKKKENGFIVSNKTQRLELQAAASEITDATRYFLSEDYLQNKIAEFERASCEDVLFTESVMPNIAKELGLSEDAGALMTEHFISQGDHSHYGIARAMTSYARDLEPDARFDLEESALDIMAKASSFDHPVSK